MTLSHVLERVIYFTSTRVSIQIVLDTFHFVLMIKFPPNILVTHSIASITITKLKVM